MYDEKGNKLDEWLLKDIAGVNSIENDNAYSNNDWSGYVNFLKNSFKKYIPDTFPPVNSVRYQIEKGSASSLASFIDPATAVSSETWVNWWSPPPSKETGKPAIIMNRYGEGTVYYCAFDLFKLANEDFPWVNGFFHGLIEECLPNPLIHLNTDTPHILGIVSYERKGKLLIHILSFLADKAEGDLLPVKGGNLRISEETFIVEQVRIIYPDGKQLPLKKSDGFVTLEVPEIMIHSMLEITVKKR